MKAELSLNTVLIFFAIKYNGDWDEIYHALQVREQVSTHDINVTLKQIENSPYKAVTIIDPDYPEQLKNGFKPPFVLWWYGASNVLKHEFIYPTGTDAFGRSLEFATKFAVCANEKEKLLVTGLFRGVDEIIAPLFTKPKLFISLSSLKDFNSKDFQPSSDLVISEHYNTIEATKDMYRARNRVLAAFANYLVLFSSRADSGIMNLVTNFLELGKDVYCYPGDGSSNDGNSLLIKQGATLITNCTDIP